MSQQPVPPSTGPTAALTWLNQTNGFDFKSLSPGQKRLKFKPFTASIIAWMLQTQAAEFDNPHGFMAYTPAILTQAQFQLYFPNANPLPAPVQPAPPANPNAPNMAAHAALVKVYAVYVQSVQQLKLAFEHYFESDIVHLRHELLQYHAVTPAQMWDAAFAIHGTPQTEDVETLRQATLLPCDRTITAEENVVLLLSRYKALADLGPDYAVNPGLRLIEATKFLAAMSPATNTIVDKYYSDTDFALRTADALFAAVQNGLRRLPVQPDLSAIRSVYSVTHQTYEFHAASPPSAYVAAATAADTDATAFAVQNSKGGGGKKSKKAEDMTIDELRSFYSNCKVGHYCFAHGWGSHSSVQTSTAKGCNTMKNDPKYTPAMKALVKPEIRKGVLQPVDGILPSVVVQSGFRGPN